MYKIALKQNLYIQNFNTPDLIYIFIKIEKIAFKL